MATTLDLGIGIGEEKQTKVMANYQIFLVFCDPETKELFQEEEIIPIFLVPDEVGHWEIADEKFLKVAKSWLETQCQRRGLEIESCSIYDPRRKRREELEPLLREQG